MEVVRDMNERGNLEMWPRPVEEEREPAAGAHPLVEPSLFYAPPYERPVEDEFAWHLVKYLEPSAGLAYQYRVETPFTRFWIDFVVEYGGRHIAFECSDLFTDADETAYRDALIVGSGAIDVLYRFRTEDLLHHLHDVLLLISRWEPALFSRRGHINLQTLASQTALAEYPRPDTAEVELSYPAPIEEDVYDGDVFEWPAREAAALKVRRMSRTHPSTWLRQYDQALGHFGITPEQLGNQWSRTA